MGLRQGAVVVGLEAHDAGRHKADRLGVDAAVVGAAKPRLNARRPHHGLDLQATRVLPRAEGARVGEGRVGEVEQVLDHEAVVNVEVAYTRHDGEVVAVVAAAARPVIGQGGIARPHPHIPRAEDAGVSSHPRVVRDGFARGERRDADARPRPVKPPAVVGALDPACLHPPHRERGGPVRTEVGQTTGCPRLVPKEHQRVSQQRRREGAVGGQIVAATDRVPVVAHG